MIGDTNYRISNAVIDGVSNPSLKEEGFAIGNYLIECFSQEKVLSEIIKEAPSKLGYHIHPSSFDMCISMFSKRVGIPFNRMLARLDDLSLYVINPTFTNTPIKNSHYGDTYYSLIQQNTETDNFYTVDASSINDSSSDNSNSSNDSSNETDLNCDNNNTKIILLTILAFVLIQIIAWYARRNNKKENMEQCDVKDNEIESEDKLFSILEPYVNFNLTSRLLILFVPPILMFLYTFKLYYYYRVVFFVKHNFRTKQ